MSSKSLLILGFAFTAIASEFFFECTEDTTKRCLTANATIPDNQFCGTCFEESDHCTICSYFAADPEANDFDHMFSEYWGAWILSFIGAIALIATPVIFCTFFIGRFACDVCGGRFPNYGFAMVPEPGTPLPVGAPPTNRVSPTGAPLRPYTTKEILAPRIGLIVVLVFFVISFICFIVTAAETSNSVDHFFENARAQATTVAVTATAVLDNVETIVKRDGRAFAAARTALVSTRNYIFELGVLDSNLATFYETDGGSIETVLEVSRWFLLIFAIFAIIVVATGLIVSFMKVRNVCPLALAAVMFWVVTISWIGVLVTLGPAWFINDACGALDVVINPGDTLAPSTGLISLLNGLSSDPVVGVDMGRMPLGVWTDTCTEFTSLCISGPPTFSCTLNNNCSIPTNPTRTGFSSFLSQSTFTFQGSTTSFTDCAAGLGACNCTQYEATNLAAYDTCLTTLKPPAVSAVAVEKVLADLRAAVLSATAAETGAVNVAVLQDAADSFVDECDSVAAALIWACVGFLLLAVFGCGSTVCLIMGAKRNIDAGHVPVYEQDPHAKQAAALPSQQGQQSTLVANTEPSLIQQPIKDHMDHNLTGSSVLAAPRPISGGGGVIELFAGPDGALYAPVDQVQDYGDAQGGGHQAYPNASVVVPEQQDARWALQDDQWPAPQVAF